MKMKQRKKIFTLVHKVKTSDCKTVIKSIYITMRYEIRMVISQTLMISILTMQQTSHIKIKVMHNYIFVKILEKEINITDE